jgi:predicted dinucleotide-binding enzyme
MRIGIIGSGNIGATAARLFVNAGHQVAISNSRGPQTLTDLVEELGDNAMAVNVDAAVHFGDVVLIAIPFGRYKELPFHHFEDKLVIDATNYYPERDGHFAELDEGKTTSSEMIADFLGGGRNVKAFNTIWFEHLKTQGDNDRPLDERRAIFIAGDDSGAKTIVADLIEDIGFAAVDTGFLREGGEMQKPGTPIYNRDLTVREAAKVLAETWPEYARAANEEII